MPENALNTIFVLYKLPLNIQDYLSSKGLSIGYSILYSAPKMHFNKYISGIASTLLQAPYNRNIACFSNPDRSNH